MKAASPTAYILLIDDDEELRLTIKEFMENVGHHVTAVSSVMRAEEAMRNGQFDLAVLDMCLPDGNGLELLKKFKATSPNMGVILITGYAEMDNATQALRFGADDFFSKPCAIDDILSAVDTVLQKNIHQNDIKTQTNAENLLDISKYFIGKSKEIKHLQKSIPHFAQSHAHIFISGAMGTGKTLLATTLHQFSAHAKQKLVHFDCKVLENPFEQQLCANKMLLLEHIDALRPDLQQQLDSLLQNSSLNIRVISTTEQQQATSLSPSLLQQLTNISIHLPCLRERGNDIEDLTAYFLQQSGEGNGISYTLSPEAKELLNNHPWQGNVTALKNSLQQATLSQQGSCIEAQDLPDFLETATDNFARKNKFDLSQHDTFDLKKSLEKIETQVLHAALERFNWNQFHTAKFLKMNRTTLIEKIKKRGIQRTQGTVRADKT